MQSSTPGISRMTRPGKGVVEFCPRASAHKFSCPTKLPSPGELVLTRRRVVTLSRNLHHEIPAQGGIRGHAGKSNSFSTIWKTASCSHPDFLSLSTTFPFVQHFFIGWFLVYPPSPPPLPDAFWFIALSSQSVVPRTKNRLQECLTPAVGVGRPLTLDHKWSNSPYNSLGALWTHTRLKPFGFAYTLPFFTSRRSGPARFLNFMLILVTHYLVNIRSFQFSLADLILSPSTLCGRSI